MDCLEFGFESVAWLNKAKSMFGLLDSKQAENIQNCKNCKHASDIKSQVETDAEDRFYIKKTTCTCNFIVDKKSMPAWVTANNTDVDIKAAENCSKFDPSDEIKRSFIELSNLISKIEKFTE